MDYFDKLGGSDQDALFRGNINAADMTGATKYAHVNSWRTSMLAGIKLDQFVESASTKGDPYVQAKNDPKLAAALKLSEAKDQSTTWAQQIADLLGGRDRIQDKVDLSDAAKRVVAATSSTSSSAKAPVYEAGSVASKTV